MVKLVEVATCGCRDGRVPQRLASCHSARLLLLVAIVAVAACLAVCSHAEAATADETAPAPAHSNNWAVLVSTSRYWFNYRHTANAMALYHTVKKMGIPDAQIILMLPDEYACNPRNPYAPRIFNSQSEPQSSPLNLYPSDIEVDYRGTEVSVQSFLRLLTGRHTSTGTSRSQRLLTNSESNIFVYMSGHGGNNFLKFQDNEEMNAQDLRDAFQQMKAQQRYRSILFMLDTCQAATLFWELNAKDTPDIITIGSSKIGENSYSHSNDYSMGLSLSDRFTYHTLEYFERNNVITDHNQRRAVPGHQQSGGGLSSRKTVADLFSSYSPAMMRSNIEFRSDLLSPALVRRTRARPDPLAHLPLTDYFGAVTHVQPAREAYELSPAEPTQPQPRRQRSKKRVASAGPAASSPLPTRAPSASDASVVVLGVSLLLALVLADLCRPSREAAASCPKAHAT